MRIAAFVLSLLFASASFAGELFIPATFRGNGANNTTWRTEIAVSNVSGNSDQPVATTVTLYRENADPVSLFVAIPRMGSVTAVDALREWFGVETGGGLVRILWDDPNARIAARARVYNTGAAGEYGQGVPAKQLNRLLTDAFLPGVSGLNGNRTNVGVSNPHPTFDAFVGIAIYDSAGVQRGAVYTTIPPRSFRQINDIFAAAGIAPLDGALVRVNSGNSTIYAYASVVRNDTGDATFIAPAE